MREILEASRAYELSERLLLADHFSGRVEQSVGCMCLCVRTITFERLPSRTQTGIYRAGVFLLLVLFVNFL